MLGSSREENPDAHELCFGCYLSWVMISGCARVFQGWLLVVEPLSLESKTVFLLISLSHLPLKQYFTLSD